jgi:dihydropteroate synthase
MGILNITPDSFSGDGLLGNKGQGVREAVAQAQDFLNNGADILDANPLVPAHNPSMQMKR